MRKSIRLPNCVGQVSRAVGVMRMLCALAAVAGPVGHAVAADAYPLPQESGAIHLGVASCAGSTCHGTTRPFDDSTVLQNEYVTWAKEDLHAQAYKVLLEEASQRISRNLGRDKPPHEDKLCLDCHADYVVGQSDSGKSMQGRRFQMSDGVGCEACHGGAENWLGPHVAGTNTREENVAAGLYPTEDPQARAALCLSCHFGNDNKFVTHEMMGAGHPRMSFELDTFTRIQPAHYEIDQDYFERKQVAGGVQTWAIGQAMALESFLTMLADPEKNHSGLMPELVFFDCQACHHSLNDTRWQPRPSTGLGPGVVRLNDANMLMLVVLAQRIDAALGAALSQGVRDLHHAGTRSLDDVEATATALLAVTRRLQARIADYVFSDASVRGLLVDLVNQGSSGEYFDYAAAEQSVMAMSALIGTLQHYGTMSDDEFARLNAQVDTLYDALSDYDRYDRALFNDGLKRLSVLLGG